MIFFEKEERVRISLLKIKPSGRCRLHPGGLVLLCRAYKMAKGVEYSFAEGLAVPAETAD